MSKRLQVILDDAELAEVKKAAKRSRMTTAEWVRQALRAAQRRQPAVDPAKKLAAVRLAAKHAFPTGDIQQMLQEIEEGYVGPGTP
jgi:hypothetical protein